MSWANFNKINTSSRARDRVTLKTIVSWGIPQELSLPIIEAYSTDQRDDEVRSFIVDQRWSSSSVNSFNPAGRLEATNQRPSIGCCYTHPTP